jgi:hypothetical protein
MPEIISHDTRLYTLGKGILSFDRLDVDGLPTGLRDVGNCTNFTMQVTEETLKHYSEREGVRTLDLEVTTTREAIGKFSLDEYDKANLSMALMATENAQHALEGMKASNVMGELDLWMTNDVGAKYHIQIWKAKLKTAGEVGFITDDWGKLDFEWTAQSDAVNHPENPYYLLTPLAES